MKLQMVPIEKVFEIQNFNTRSRGIGDITDLTNSIQAVGVLEPLLGKDVDGKSGAIEIYAGFRRLQAARDAGLKEVPVMVTSRNRLTPKQMLLGNVVENVQREELNPVDEAFALKRLHEEHEMSLDDISLELGLKKARVKARFQLLKYADVILEAVRDERISVMAASEIARLPAEMHAKFIGLAENLRGVKLVELVEKALEKLSAQVEMENEGGQETEPEGTSDAVTLLQVIRTSGRIACSRMRYTEQEAEDFVTVDFGVLSIPQLQAVSTFVDRVAGSFERDIDVNEEVAGEFTSALDEKIEWLNIESPIVLEAIERGLMARAKEIAAESATDGKPRVTFANAQQVLGGVFLLWGRRVKPLKTRPEKNPNIVVV